jgi:CheY-like chemotaxis protein
MPGEAILVVDDTPVNLKLTRILLEHEGYQVRTAASGEEALEVLEGFRPRLVLADIQLPGIDGLEMTRRIKAEPRNADMLVVALTAYAMKGDEEKARAAGCDGYITKPIDTRVLGARLRAYLDRSPASAAPGAPAPVAGSLLPEAEMSELRARFLDEGLRLAGQWEEDLAGDFRPHVVAAAIHQWIGAASLLGLSAISLLAREVEELLREAPLDIGQFRELLDSLVRQFRDPAAAAGMLAPPSEPVAGAEGRVLIASADAAMLALLKAMLQSQGIECQTAADGPSALDAIRQTRPAAAALDADLPGIGGAGVWQAIREEGLPVRVLLLSAEPPPATPASDFLLKPFDPIELVVRLKRLALDECGSEAT